MNPVITLSAALLIALATNLIMAYALTDLDRRHRAARHELERWKGTVYGQRQGRSRAFAASDDPLRRSPASPWADGDEASQARPKRA